MAKKHVPKVAEVMAEVDAKRKPHVPTDETRADVKKYSSLGLPADVIATAIGISEVTLKKYYIPEMQEGQSKKKILISSWAFGAAQKGSIPMIMFLCKTQLGWRETNHLEVSGQIDIKPVINFISSQAQKLEEEKQKLLLEEPDIELDPEPEDK